MDASALIQDLRGAGFDLRVQANRLLVAPASRLNEDQIAAIRAHRDALVAAVSIERLTPTARALVDAINAACQLRGDDDANRRALIDESLAMTESDQADLTVHFLEVARMYRAIFSMT